MLLQALKRASALRTPTALRTRAFSSSQSAAAAEEHADQVNKARFVRFFAAIFMLTAGATVAPYAAANSVDHTIKLMDTKEPFLQSAGVSRLNLITKLEAARRRALETGAMSRLLRLLDGDDPKLRRGALAALRTIVGNSLEGREALVQAGGVAVLRRAVGKLGNNQEEREVAENLLLDCCRPGR